VPDPDLRVGMCACGLACGVGGVGGSQLLVLCCAVILDYGFSCVMILD
jgi:hypothetical protein